VEPDLRDGFHPGRRHRVGASGRVDVALLVPFAAGNFAYLGVVDLLPEATTSVPPGQRHRVVTAFLIGLALLGIAARVT
jgi:zinc and cadmium transporter